MRVGSGQESAAATAATGSALHNIRTGLDPESLARAVVDDLRCLQQ